MAKLVIVTKIRKRVFSPHHLQIKTHGSESVVAGDHGAQGVAHPSVEEVAAAGGEVFHERAHGFPGGVAEALRLAGIFRNPAAADGDAAGVLDGVFVDGHEVGVFRPADCGYLDFFHFDRGFRGILSNPVTPLP